MIKVKLYGTLGCHLCDQAEYLLNAILIDGTPLFIQQIDIADDPNLVARLGLEIPVLEYKNNQLKWPFDTNSVIEMLS